MIRRVPCLSAVCAAISALALPPPAGMDGRASPPHRAEAPPAGHARDAEHAAALLHARKADLLLKRYLTSPARDRAIRGELECLRGRIERARATEPPLPLPGLAEEAYLSPLDGSAQPFFRYLPAAWGGDARRRPPPALPLLVYLHGYHPDLDLLNWSGFPPVLTNLAERLDACLACPFGRGNTDYQGIGEQDVLQVVDLMQARYGIDPARVILVGYSMGGMGAWTLGARFAERINGLMIIAGRGDYYAWQGLEPESLPPWERAWIDAHFLSGQAHRLTGMPILAFHGTQDLAVGIEEARGAFRILQPHNPQARLVEIPGGDHGIFQAVLEQPICRTWLAGVTRIPRKGRPPPLGIRPGEVPSRLQNAFLDPFLLVDCRTTDFEKRCREWEAYAKAAPRQRREPALAAADFRESNLFLFGEPETSPLIARLFAIAGIAFDPESFLLQGRRMARGGRGLWLALPSPWAHARTIAIQCGTPWGQALPDNHRYDRLPDLIVYSAETGRLGASQPVAAARIDAEGRFLWYDTPGGNPSALAPIPDAPPPRERALPQDGPTSAPDPQTTEPAASEAAPSADAVESWPRHEESAVPQFPSGRLPHRSGNHHRPDAPGWPADSGSGASRRCGS